MAYIVNLRKGAKHWVKNHQFAPKCSLAVPLVGDVNKAVQIWSHIDHFKSPPPFQFWTFSWRALQRLHCLSKVTVSFLFAAKQWVHVIKQNTHPCRWYRWSGEITCHQTIVTSSIPYKTNLSDYQRISVCKNICKDCILKIALQNKKHSILHPICSWKQCQGNKLHKLDWLHLQYKPDDKLQANPGKDWHGSCAVMRSCVRHIFRLNATWQQNVNWIFLFIVSGNSFFHLQKHYVERKSLDGKANDFVLPKKSS